MGFARRILLMLGLVGYARAGITAGSYRGSASWVFLEKFCFKEQGGKIHGEFLFPQSTNPTLMLYYLDSTESEWDSWERIYNGNYNCSEKLRLSQEKSGRTFNLTGPDRTLSREVIDGKPMVRTTFSTTISSSRRRWFFFTVGNCLPNCTGNFCSGGVDLRWDLRLENGDGAMRFFGADRDTIYGTCLAFFALYFVLSVYAYYVRSVLVNQRKYHITVVILVSSIVLGLVATLCDLIVFSLYKSSGRTHDLYMVFGQLFTSLSDFCLVFMLMLIMKGWTIVRRKISANGRMKLSIYFVLYMSTYWICLLYYRFGIDRTAVAYVFDTWPGYLLAILRVLLFVWILYARHVTLRKYNSKRRFYQKFTLLACIWSLSLPALVLMNKLIVEYYRAKLIYALQMSFTFTTQAVLISLYNPNSYCCGSSFPFHATTTAMLHGKVSGQRQPGSISNSHIRQATEISRRIRHGITILQAFSGDLNSFLDEIDPLEEELLHKDEELADASQTPAKTKAKRMRNVQPPPSADVLRKSSKSPLEKALDLA